MSTKSSGGSDGGCVGCGILIALIFIASYIGHILALLTSGGGK